MKEGSLAGCIVDVSPKYNKQYWRISYGQHKFFAHRVVYFLVSGIDPIGYEIEHRDGNSLNNNFDNLRLTERSLNAHNSKIRRNNTSGIVGVTKKQTKGRIVYVAQLVNQGKLVFKSTFKCKLEAALAYNKAVSTNIPAEYADKKISDLDTISCQCNKCTHRRMWVPRELFLPRSPDLY